MSQTKVQAYNSYQFKEELINVLTHGIGLFMSIAALVLMIVKSVQTSSVAAILTSIVFGVSLIFLYSSSTLYHGIRMPKIRNKLNVLDHLAIYVLIAGTYTPFAINTIGGALGWTIFGVIWGFALVGMVLKIFFFGKYNVLSALSYVLMGWFIIIAIRTLFVSLGFYGAFWLFLGGIFYTVGAVVFLIEKIPFNHAIFHVFVLAGSVSHFVSVYWFVLE